MPYTTTNTTKTNDLQYINQYTLINLNFIKPVHKEKEYYKKRDPIA